uniref:AlNc14C83G5355 protein n=1 Tax=Albugo laibachii Nc14 TaxID=890382 RepID=F0WFG9_9STRA|nr:AlNc14C83G5355 [Albugo laibachii Nc14]|eukprot:CCA19951.1 AlNc14C83G5355 [Albugo laibachii Nc14]
MYWTVYSVTRLKTRLVSSKQCSYSTLFILDGSQAILNHQRAIHRFSPIYILNDVRKHRMLSTSQITWMLLILSNAICHGFSI